MTTVTSLARNGEHRERVGLDSPPDAVLPEPRERSGFTLEPRDDIVVESVSVTWPILDVSMCNAVIAEHLQMMLDRRPTHAELIVDERLEVTGIVFAARQNVNDSPPNRLSEQLIDVHANNDVS